MNNTDSHPEQEFVPEVDVASLQGVAPPPIPEDVASPALGHSDQSLPATAGQALSADPTQAMQQLPPALTAHIQDLIAQADAEGYLRGRNEVIEATQHFDASNDDCDPTPVSFPHYDRLSIWDI